MAKSQNGWTVIGKSGTEDFLIPGSSTRARLRKGSAGYVLRHFAGWFDRNIEDIDTAHGKKLDDWGWAVRLIYVIIHKVRRATQSLSNHGSGTAIDLNALRHPQNKRDTFSQDHYARIDHELATTYRGLIRWGAHYKTTVDEMHFEIIGTEAQINALAAALKARAAPVPSHVVTKPWEITGVTYTNSKHKIVVTHSTPVHDARKVLPDHRPVLQMYASDKTPQGWVKYWQQLIKWHNANGYLSPDCVEYACNLPHLKKVYASDKKVGPKTWAASERGH